MKIYLKYVFLVSCLTLASCNDWLSIQPKSQASQEALFSSPEGFESALMGIYTQLQSDDLYSYDLTMAKMDVLGQYYEIQYGDYGSIYSDLQKYDYKSGSAITFFNAIWSKFYRAIANCNVLIQALDKNEEMLTPARFHLIKGEAYALRAFLHLELLRMFAPRYETGNEQGIPYVENFDMIISPHLTTKHTLEKIITDFNIAISELKHSDPILSPDYVVNNNWWWGWTNPDESVDNFSSYRSERINYYAAHALLARAYMWMGDGSKALPLINTILASKLYPGENETGEWTFTDADRLVQFEILFAVANPKIIKSYERYTKIVNWEKSPLLILADVNGWFADQGDYRKLHNIKKNAESYDYSLKYEQGEDSWNGQKVPVIRLAELLYYKAEILFDQNQEEAIRTLTDFQKTRGVLTTLETSISKEDFIQLIVEDARREFIAEGQYFLFNKRLNRNLSYADQEIEMKDFWVFPKPDSEIEFGYIN